MRQALVLTGIFALTASVSCGAPEVQDTSATDTARGADSILPLLTYTPRRNDLCQAVENIQFYAADFSTPSYVVTRGQNIRIDINGDTLVDWTQGHGEGHSDRSFIYRHSNGDLRLTNCHQ